MRVFILTLGTRGDFQLFLTLGRALRRRGHEVILGASPFFSPSVRQAQLGWVPIGTGSLEGLVSILQSLASEPDAAKRTHRFYARWLQPQLSMSMSQITGAGARADYFISNLKMVLQRDGKIIPGAAVTYDPPGALEDLAKYGTQNHHGLILDLVAMSRRLVDPDGRWGAAYHFTGFWTDGPPADWTPSPDLQTFVSAGPPPVVVTMGSMVMFDAEAWVRDLLEALRLSCQRGIIVGGWSRVPRVDASQVPAYFAEEIPYAWLFPKAACVVHHGGVGTLAAVLRAGKPSILFPQITAQEHFGRMLTREHLAAGVFETRGLQPDRLAAAIHKAVSDEQCRESARRWQGVVLEERGVGAAVDLIAAHWERVRQGGDG